MVHLSLVRHLSSDGVQLPGSLKWSWVARWYWCEQNNKTKLDLNPEKIQHINPCLSPVSLLVFVLQSLLQVLDWAGDGGEGALWTQGLELLLHVNISALLLLGDGCHLLDFFLCRLQRLAWGKKTELENWWNNNRQYWLAFLSRSS